MASKRPNASAVVGAQGGGVWGPHLSRQGMGFDLTNLQQNGNLRVLTSRFAMPFEAQKPGQTPATTPAKPGAVPGAPGSPQQSTRDKVARTNYAGGAALVNPDNKPGYVGTKEAVTPKPGAPVVAKPADKEGKGLEATVGTTVGEAKFGSAVGKSATLVQSGGGDDKDKNGKKDEGGHAAKPKGPSLPKVADVGPSKELLKEHGDKKDLGGGKYQQTWAGTAAKNEVKPAAEVGKDGVKAELASGEAMAGAGVKLGVGGQLEKTGKYGKAEAKGDAGVTAQAGAKGYYKVGTDGVIAGADASAKAGAEASGSAEVTSNKFLGGDAGAGAQGKVFAGARVGAGAKVGVTKEFVGAKGSVGGFAGVEAKGDIHAHVGPVGGKLEASAQAGIGASLEGEVTYEKGKLKISAKAALALGIGGSVGGSVEIDIGQAIKMGGELAKIAYKFADQDGDGRLTLNDPATLAAKGIRGGAKGVDKGVDKAIAAMDADGDGKFSSNDVKLRAQQAGQAVAGAGKAVVGAGKQAVAAGKKALDADGDGKLGLNDVKVGAKNVGNKLVAAEQRVVSSAKGAAKWAAKEGGELKDAAAKTLHKAGTALHNAADQDGDGKLSMNDVKVGAGHAKDAVVGAGKSAVHAVGQGAKSAAHAVGEGAKWAGGKVAAGATKLADGAAKAGHAIHDAADVNGDGKLGADDIGAALHHASQAVSDKAHAAKTAIHDSLDVNGDGKVDAGDAKAAAEAAKKRAIAAYHSSVDAAKAAAHKTIDTAKAAAAAAKRGMDRDGDGKLGLGDVAAGAKQAYQGAKTGAGKVVGAVKAKGGAVLKDLRAQASAAKKTFTGAVDDAAATLKGSWSKISGFFGG